MRKVVLILGSAMVILFADALVSPGMRGPAPAEVARILAKQHLQEVWIYYESFRQDRGRAPTTVQELLDAGFIEGVVEPHRTKILSQLEFPITQKPSNIQSLAELVAIYHTRYGSFYLLSDRTIQSQPVLSPDRQQTKE